MSLDLIASELSIVIFENDHLSHNKIIELLKEHIDLRFNILPCHIDYVIDTAFEIYERM